MIIMPEMRDAASDEPMGRLIRVSPDELVILSGAAFDVYRKYDLIVRSSLQDDGEPLRLSTRCLWSREEDASGFFLNGLELAENSPAVMRGFTRFVSRSGTAR